MGNPRRVDETETDFLVRRLRECKTPKDFEEAIKSALTFPGGVEAQQSKLDVQRVYNESCILVDEFIARYEQRWGFRWLPERPTYNEDPVAGLHEHRQWYNAIDGVIWNGLPCRFSPEKVELSIKCFEELRDLLVKYPSYDQEVWERAKEQAGVPEKLSSMTTTNYHFRLLEEAREEARRASEETRRSGLSMSNSPLLRLTHQARVAELEAALEARVAYTPDVDRCYRELDGRYADAVKQLGEEVQGLWKGRILPLWREGEPIGLYDALTGKTITGPMERLDCAASEIADGRIANHFHRKQTLNNCEALIALFTGFREKIGQAESVKAKSSEETTSPQTGKTKGHPAEEKLTGQRQKAGTAGTKESGSAAKTVNIQNSNVIMADVHHPENLVLGDHASIRKETPISQKNKKNIKRTITAFVVFLAALLTVLQIFFGWMGIIWRFLTAE